jgi:hypothetical protein
MGAATDPRLEFRRLADEEVRMHLMTAEGSAVHGASLVPGLSYSQLHIHESTTTFRREQVIGHSTRRSTHGPWATAQAAGAGPEVAEGAEEEERPRHIDLDVDAEAWRRAAAPLVAESRYASS